MSKIEFHEITLDDKAWMDARFQEDDRNACEYTFANNFVWRKVYHVEVAEKYGCAIIRFEEEGVVMYSYPIGAGDHRKVIDELRTICEEEKRPLIMSPLSEADREQMLTWYSEQFLIQGDRNDYDYIYTREKLATLAGKKMHGKRNHIARFQDEDDWCYEELNDSNIEECRNMTYTWIKMRAEKWNEEMELEMSVLHEAFDHRKELGLVGGIIRKAGQIVAFSIGEPLNSDTYVVHFEKAFPDMQGAYPMINQQFVLHVCEEYTYVNREEDTGDPGLRKAKMSYYPEILLKKYVAISSDVICADKDRNREESTIIPSLSYTRRAVLVCAISSGRSFSNCSSLSVVSIICRFSFSGQYIKISASSALSSLEISSLHTTFTVLPPQKQLKSIANRIAASSHAINPFLIRFCSRIFLYSAAVISSTE